MTEDIKLRAKKAATDILDWSVCPNGSPDYVTDRILQVIEEVQEAQRRADTARAVIWWRTQAVSVINYQDIENFRKAMGTGLDEKNAIAVMDAMADWLDSRRAVPAPYSIKAFTRAVRYATRQLTKQIKL